MTDVSTENNLDNKLVAEMAEAGVLYAHKKSKADPRMRQFIVANRHEINLIDAGVVMNTLDKAAAFLKEILSKGGRVLFVATTPAASNIVRSFAEEYNQPYVIHRWLGGTLTNFEVIRKRVDYYLEMKGKQESGELDKYTKKERTKFSQEISKLSYKFEGLLKLDRLPDAIFVVDAKEHKTAVKEAVDMDIPIVAIIDTDDNPEPITYPIVANDHSSSSISWVIDKLRSKISN